MARTPSVEWQSIVSVIRADIEGGRYPLGSQLPNETAFMALLGCGRYSLRRALHELAGTGLIRTEHGKGSFVQRCEVLDYKISLRTRATPNLNEQGRASTDQPVSEETEPASQIVAEALQIEEGAPVYVIVRHSFADDIPISVTTAYHPVDRFPEIDKARRSLRRLTEIYASYGVADYFRLKTTVTARMPTPKVARFLQLSPQYPVLVTQKIDADTNCVPIAYAETVWAANRIQFVIDNTLEISRLVTSSTKEAAE